MLAAIAAAVVIAPSIADAHDNRTWRARSMSWGIIGGLSANAIVGGYYPEYVGYPGVAYYPAPLPVASAAPTYPPPGCVIRQQPVPRGNGWSMRKIRVCY